MYKIMDQDDKGNLKTLFHGIGGTRIMPQGEWIQANIKQVSDGGSTMYTSGWHMLPTLDECLDYLGRFKNTANKVIVECKVKGDTWEKEHSRSNVILTEWMCIDQVVWRSKDGRLL